MKERPDPFAPRAKKAREIPFEFVLEALAPLAPTTRLMFGSTAIYLEPRILFVLRRKHDADDGVWVAYEPELEREVLQLFPALETIEVLGAVRGWRKLSAAHPEFEDEVLRACKLVRSGESRLGKVPLSKKPRAAAAKKIKKGVRATKRTNGR